MGNILEISKRNSKGGRRKVKMVLLTIHENSEHNLNGIGWKIENVVKNIESVKNIPICCSFVDDEKRVPSGHGNPVSVVDKDGVRDVLFTDSEVVGTIYDAKIEEIIIDGEIKKVLVGYGYVYVQRYKEFYDWLVEEMKTGTIKSSIEVVGLEENDRQIVYEGGYNEDYRVPSVFDFSATAILAPFIKEADENCVVLEAAQKSNQNKEETFEMTEKEILEVVQKSITETNSANDALNAKIAELNAQIEEKDAELKKVQEEKEAEANACGDKDKEIEELNAKVSELEAKVAEAKVAEQNSALEKAIENFSESEKKYAEVEINSFKVNPLDGDIEAIKTKILAGIGEATKTAEAEAKLAEINSAKEQETKADDILGDIVELNNATDEFDLLA